MKIRYAVEMEVELPDDFTDEEIDFKVALLARGNQCCWMKDNGASLIECIVTYKKEGINNYVRENYKAV